MVCKVVLLLQLPESTTVREGVLTASNSNAPAFIFVSSSIPDYLNSFQEVPPSGLLSRKGRGSRYKFAVSLISPRNESGRACTCRGLTGPGVFPPVVSALTATRKIPGREQTLGRGQQTELPSQSPAEETRRSQ